jgi:hypothetical protein
VIDSKVDSKGKPFYTFKEGMFELDDIDDSVQVVVIDE